MSERVDLGMLAAGIAIVGLGLLVLLQEEGTIALQAGWLLPAVTATAGIALLASGLGARNR